MRLKSLETVPVAYPEPNDSGSTRCLLFVRATDEDGRTGWGEAVTMWPEATLAAGEVVAGFERLLAGVEFEHPQEVWDLLAAHTWWYGNGGIAAFAISAVDIAVWDLVGRARGVSVLDMLGGARHPSLPALISCHAMDGNLERLVATLAGWVSGAKAQGVKVAFGKRGEARLGYERQRDLTFLQLLREALGPGARIMVDISATLHWDVATAVERAHDWEPLDIAWVEEPLGADNPAGYQALRAATSIPIGYGEREWTARGVERIVQTGTVDVVGIAPGRLEGITGFMRAAGAVAAGGARVNAHAWSSVVVTAASLAASLAAESSFQLEMKPLPNPMQDDVAVVPVRPREGHFYPLAGPGLGVDLDEQRLYSYRLA